LKRSKVQCPEKNYKVRNSNFRAAKFLVVSKEELQVRNSETLEQQSPLLYPVELKG